MKTIVITLSDENGNFNYKLFEELTGSDYFSETKTSKGKSDFTAYMNDINEEDFDFETKKILEAGSDVDEMFRDADGNYMKNTQYYQNVKDAGFPYGDDRNPDAELDELILY